MGRGKESREECNLMKSEEAMERGESEVEEECEPEGDPTLIDSLNK